MKISVCKKVLFCISLLVLFQNCKNDLDLPIVYTIGITDPNINSAFAYGSITGREITSKGFCWDTIDNPSMDKNMIDLGSNSQSFSAEINGLLAKKKYYLRAFATNEKGTSFGSVTTFYTITPPAVFTDTPSATSYSTAIVSGSAASTSSVPAYETGVCYGTNHNPNVSGSKMTNGSSSSFSYTLNNLSENTIYYVRAYAKYNIGTYYGKEESFKTPRAPVIYSISGTVTDADGNEYNTVKIGAQTWMTENLRVHQYNDGTTIPYVTNPSTWSGISYGAYGNINNNVSNEMIHGNFYNLKALNDPRVLAPVGWHIPTIEEWQTLIDNIGGASMACAQLMATGGRWPNASNCVPTNYSAMSLLPGGYRSELGYDYELNFTGNYWTSSSGGQSNSGIYFSFDSWCAITTITVPSSSSNKGVFIRCVKD